MSLEYILVFLILFYIIYLISTKIGSKKTFMGVSIFVVLSIGLNVYLNDHYNITDIIKNFAELLLMFLAIFVIKFFDLQISYNFIIKLIFGISFCFWMHDVFSLWGLLAALIITFILVLHKGSISAIFPIIWVIGILLLAQVMGIVGFIFGVIVGFLVLMPMYNMVRLAEEEN